MLILARLLRLFFYLLYHPFANTYDLVAWTVSLGRWKDWVQTVVPFIKGEHVLELGYGSGHLQRLLLDLGLFAVGLDESRQMGYLAKKRTTQNGDTRARLVRGLGECLPFPQDSFDTILATFPTNYIFEGQTLLEVRRTLKNGGRFVVLPVALITGKKTVERLAAWVFRVTGQAPSEPIESVGDELKKPFLEAGFQVEIHQVEVKSSLVLILVAAY